MQKFVSISELKCVKNSLNIKKTQNYQKNVPNTDVEIYIIFYYFKKLMTLSRSNQNNYR
jgi:hypothetical protein